jgi:hypothetical protein
MKPAEIEVKISIAQKEADYWRGILADRRCGNCKEWHKEMCRKYQASPPQGEKEPGCDEWSWDSIPFK